MIRRPLRPLARILSARAQGKDPDLIEAEERAARLAARHRAERQKAETRLLLLGLVFVLGFTTVAGRMAMLSAAVPVEPRAASSSDPIRAQRAEIVDRNGALLATNIVTASLYAQPAMMIDPKRAAAELAGIFPDLDAGTLEARFTDGRKFLWIKRSISPEQRQRVHDLGEPGLLFGPREARLYPNGAVAAHVLGGASYGREGVHAAEVVGTAGVERVFDARLRDPERSDEDVDESLDGQRNGARFGARGQLHGIGTAERAISAGVPHAQVAQHGWAQIAIRRQHGVERLFIIANESGPALQAIIKIIVTDDAR